MTDLTFTQDGSPDYLYWAVVGPAGGVHIWAMPTPESRSAVFPGKFYGGVEVHYRTEPGPGYSHNKDCWLLGGPCYHDGSSLYFSERIEPMMRGHLTPEELTQFMNGILREWYRDKLGAKANDG
jgi:hypothetical protein